MTPQPRASSAPRNLPELVAIGRVSVDLYAEQVGAPIRTVRTFRKSIGGTATNVAVATARLGHRVALVTKVGNDGFGGYVRHALEHTFGVDIRFVGTDPDLMTPLAFAELDPPEDPNIIFYREPSAPDMNLAPDDIDFGIIGETPILWIPASRLSAEPSRSTVREVLSRRARAPEVVFDLDWRPAFWPSEEKAAAEIGPILDRVTIAIGNREECRIAVGTSDPEEATRRMLSKGLEAVVVKLGGDGVLVTTSDGYQQRIPPFPVEVVCGLGAGDAFGGAFCHGLLNGWTVGEAARYGNAAGAIVASRLMCADDMPNLEEIEAFLARRDRPDQTGASIPPV